MFGKKLHKENNIPLSIYDAALMGNPRAQYVLGAALAMGEGAEHNLQGGQLLLKQSAEGGCAEAWFVLYKISMGKRFGINDTENGLTYLRRAADEGVIPAMRDLGLMLIDGNDYLAADPITARALLREAAEKGDEKAINICRARF